MAKTVRIEHISAGWREILMSEPVKQLVSDNAEAVRSRAESMSMMPGAEWTAEVSVGSYGGGRIVGYVRPANLQAMIDEASGKMLEVAVNA